VLSDGRALSRAGGADQLEMPRFIESRKTHAAEHKRSSRMSRTPQRVPTWPDAEGAVICDHPRATLYDF